MNSTVKPLCIELFAGLHGWGEGFASEGFQVIGFDIVDMGKVCGVPRPAGCELVLQDVLTLSGATRKICPACPTFTYASCALCHGEGFVTRYIPLIVENVRGAIPWVGKRMLADESEWFKLPEAVRVRLGRSAWNYKSFHLWGDVPALMPVNSNGGVKLGGGRSWTGKNGYGSPDYKPFGFNVENAKVFAGTWRDGIKGLAGARRISAAIVAKIPTGLSQHIAAVYHPKTFPLKAAGDART